jgi:hypothetical protein
MVNLLYPANLSIRMANIDISNLYVHVVVPTMDIFTCIWQEIKSKGGGPLTFSAIGREEEIEMEFNSEIFRVFDNDCKDDNHEYDLNELLGNLIEKQIDEGKELREWIDNSIQTLTDEFRVHNDLSEHINALNTLSQEVGLAVGFVLGRDFGLEPEPAEAKMIRDILKAAGIYEQILSHRPRA